MGGSPRVAVTTGQCLPDLDWPDELAQLTSSRPCLGPTWLRATENALPEIRPWHTIATRARGELALTAGYIVESPPAAGHEPRAYLGWQAGGGEECGGTRCDSVISAEVEALGSGPFFPVLLLGSPLGYRTEVAYNFWTPTLMAEIAGKLVPAAFDAGVRCIIAPWIPDRRGNQALVEALEHAGGHGAFWGYEDFARLDAGSWDSHLAELPLRNRQQIMAAARRCAAEDVVIERADNAAIRPHIARIAELACLSREKNCAGEEPAHIAGLLTALLGGGADVHAHLGRKDGVLVASCVTIVKDHRLFVRWAGLDHVTVGERSGIYLATVLDAPVRDAYARGLRTVEFGARTHRAKALRGCTPRTITTVMIMSDPRLRPTITAWLDAFASSRHAAFGEPEQPGDPQLAGSSGTSAAGLSS
jgi:hypothetical protein